MDTLCSAVPTDNPIFGAERIVKVKTQKVVKSTPGVISSLNPMNWGLNCRLAQPPGGRFGIGASVSFMWLEGDVRHGAPAAGVQAYVVDFDDHLGLAKGGIPVFTIHANYRLNPLWQITYSFASVYVEATKIPVTSFAFGGRMFPQGDGVRSKLERYRHKLGLGFDLIKTSDSTTSVLAKWIYVQDKLTIGPTTGATSAITMDDDKSLLCIETRYIRCLQCYMGGMLSFTSSHGVMFLNDCRGSDTEIALRYETSIRSRWQAYIKCGYRSDQIMRKQSLQSFQTSLRGAFLQVNALF